MPYDATDFPPTEELARIKTEDDYFALLNCEAYDYAGLTNKGVFRLKEYFSNDKAKAEILAKALNIAPAIVDAGTDFLFGEPFKVEVDGENTGVQEKIDAFIERNNLQERMEESSQLFQAIGHAHFKMYAKNGEAYIEETPYSYWFPNWSGIPNGHDPDNVRIVVYITRVDGGGKKTPYVYVEDYYTVTDVTGKRSAWISYALYQEKIGKKLGDQVPLFPEMIPTGDNVTISPDQMTYMQDTGLEELPLVTINLRKTVLHRHGISIYKRIMPLLEEMNDRLTQVSIQFLKHLNAKLQIPEGAVARDPKTGKVQNADMEVLLAKEGEPDAKYITNENPLIEQAFVHMDKVIRMIAKLTKTPDSFLAEDEKGGVEKAEALKTRLMSFLKRIRNYQRKYDDAVKKIVRMALKIEGVEKADEIPLKIRFDLGLPKDWEYDVAVWGDALDRGLAARETAVARFQGISGDELDEELGKIDTEEEERMKSRVAELVAGVGNNNQNDNNGDQE